MALCGIAWAQSPGTTMSKTLLESGTLYPRLLRLEHGPAATRGHLLASTNGKIFRSTDDGRTFEYVTQVQAAAGSKERCCATLYELPQKVGQLAAGTLLSSGSYFSGTTATIEIYTSVDEGRTWTYLATPVKRGGAPHHGLWEPEFTIAKDGALVMFWSDETDPCCSQKLAQMRTDDGVTWKDERDTVRSESQAQRPGMAVVSKLPNGHYFMSYEICGPPTKCEVYERTSPDGWDWGEPTNPGMKVVSTTGQYFAHAPSNHLLPDGRLLLLGQMLFEANGEVSKQNGQVIFVSSAVNTKRSWTVLPSPVPVPTAYDNYCPNYSSALLPTADGRSLIELASDYDGAHTCVTYEGILPLK
jgi:hypothetical protein